MRRAIVLFAFVLVGFSGIGFGAIPAVQSIKFDPATPGPGDDIVAHINGIMPSGGVLITDAKLMQNGTDLTLNLQFVLGGLTVITPWSYDAQIGQLPAGTYELTVVPSAGPFLQFENGVASFTVVPEPGAVGVDVVVGLLSLSARPYIRATHLIFIALFEKWIHNAKRALTLPSPGVPVEGILRTS